jgi:purine-binding chemotaxis protein CheW
MPSNRVASFSENQVTLGCFEVGGRAHAIDVSHLREVVRWSAPTPLPEAPELIEGVIDLRGTIVPVIDLGRALGLPPVKPGLTARIAIVEIDGMVLGLGVQAALEVVAVDVAHLQDPPSLATQAGYDMARAIVRRNEGEPVVVLALENLLERIYRSALGSNGGAP